MSSSYVVAAFAIGLLWVCGAWNRQEEGFTSMGLLRCRRGPQLRSVPGLQQEGIRAAVGIACTSYIMGRLYEFGAASEGQARSTTQRASTKWLRCRIQRLRQVVQRLSGKYRFELESEDRI